jgi:hypothetical protein
VLAAEVDAAGGVFEDLKSRQLVSPRRGPPGLRNVAHGSTAARARFEVQPARIDVGQRLVEPGYAVQEYRRVSGEVLREPHLRSLLSERDLVTRVPIASIAKMTRPPSVSR